jgi:hypothetical protein
MIGLQVSRAGEKRYHVVMVKQEDIEVSVVLPCLNEETTIGMCVEAAFRALTAAGLEGEIVVADNDSTDHSREIAAEKGARVVEARLPGYGNALRTGLGQARGRYLVFLDADLSYDFNDIGRFVAELRNGAELVIGSRLRGRIDPGAMPMLHRRFGTPAMTLLANLFFGCGISDINCGMRGLTREAYARLELHSEGMEFASEMMIKAAHAHLRIAEIPIDFHPDARGRRPHLRSFRDGWRHLQLMFHFCPVWWFLLPGLTLVLGGLLVILLVPSALDLQLRAALNLGALAATTLGTQILLLGTIAQGRVKGSKYAGNLSRLRRLLARCVRIEKGVLAGLAGIVGGVFLFLYSTTMVVQTISPQGEASIQLDSGDTRLVLLATALFISGLQVFFASLFMGLFGIRVADDQYHFDDAARPRR